MPPAATSVVPVAVLAGLGVVLAVLVAACGDAAQRDGAGVGAGAGVSSPAGAGERRADERSAARASADVVASGGETERPAGDPGQAMRVRSGATEREQGAQQEPATPLAEPAAAVARMLEHCHGPLRGTMHSVVLELREAQDGPPMTIVTGTNGRLRVDDGRAVEVLAGHSSWRCPRGVRPPAAEGGAGGSSSAGSGSRGSGAESGDADTGRARGGGAESGAGEGAAATPEPIRLEGEDHDRLADLYRLVTGLCLLPLYETTRVTRQGPTVLALHLPGGETWRLQHRRGEDRPERLAGPAGEIVFEEWIDTGFTRLPRKVQLGPLGERWVTVRTSDLVADDLLFQDPMARPRRVAPAAGEAQAEAGSPRSSVLGGASASTFVTGGEHKPRRPELQRLRPTMLLVLRDPGGWDERVRLLHREGETLWQQGQVTTGLPMLFEQDGEACLGVPFEPDPDRGSQPFARRRGQRIEHRPEQWAVVVMPPRGEQREVMARGKALIDEFVAREGLRPSGPRRAILYISLDLEAPKPEELEQLEVRFEQPVQTPRRGR